MKKLNQSRFEVDYKERIAQSKEAKDSTRLPRLGYAQYRVYPIEPKFNIDANKLAKNFAYGKINRQLNVVSSYIKGLTISKSRSLYYTSGRNTGKSQFMSYMYMYPTIDKILLTETNADIQWLKPKHVTLLRMKGHTVELAEAGDRSTSKTIYSGLVSIGS